MSSNLAQTSSRNKDLTVQRFFWNSERKQMITEEHSRRGSDTKSIRNLISVCNDNRKDVKALKPRGALMKGNMREMSCQQESQHRDVRNTQRFIALGLSPRLMSLHITKQMF